MEQSNFDRPSVNFSPTIFQGSRRQGKRHGAACFLDGGQAVAQNFNGLRRDASHAMPHRRITDRRGGEQPAAIQNGVPDLRRHQQRLIDGNPSFEAANALNAVAGPVKDHLLSSQAEVLQLLVAHAAVGRLTARAELTHLTLCADQRDAVHEKIRLHAHAQQPLECSHRIVRVHDGEDSVAGRRKPQRDLRGGPVGDLTRA